MIWFHQVKHWELGNFVMATPMLHLKSQELGSPVPVLFQNKHVRELYVRCPFISIIKQKPNAPPFGTTKCVPRKTKRETDIHAYVRRYCKKYEHIPAPYVDDNVVYDFPRQSGKVHVAVFHGCLGKHLIGSKDIHPKALQHLIDTIIKRNYVPVVLGNKTDQQRFWKKVRLKNSVNMLGKLTLKETVNVLQQCDCFISNDTGLYHVAGALNKPGLVLWKNTDMIKNSSPCSRIKHYRNRKNKASMFMRAINEYLDQPKNWS